MPQHGNVWPRKPRRNGQEKAPWRKAAEAFPCETCGAGPGKACVTYGGRDAATPHTARTSLASASGWQPPDPEEDP